MLVYKIGKFVGQLIGIATYGYVGYDTYLNIVNGRSILANLAMIYFLMLCNAIASAFGAIQQNQQLQVMVTAQLAEEIAKIKPIKKKLDRAFDDITKDF